METVKKFLIRIGIFAVIVVIFSSMCSRIKYLESENERKQINCDGLASQLDSAKNKCIEMTLSRNEFEKLYNDAKDQIGKNTVKVVKVKEVIEIPIEVESAPVLNNVTEAIRSYADTTICANTNDYNACFVLKDTLGLISMNIDLINEQFITTNQVKNYSKKPYWLLPWRYLPYNYTKELEVTVKNTNSLIKNDEVYSINIK